MIVIAGTDLIVPLSALSPSEREDLSGWFQARENQAILDMGGDRWLTASLLANGMEPEDIRVSYHPDMFMLSSQIIPRTGFTIAVDEEQRPVCTLKDIYSPYVHTYSYTGTLDLRLLDRFDCLFLHGCHEFSVELCLNALQFWRGKRLVLIGEEWEGLIPLLPDLPDIECYFWPTIQDEEYLLIQQSGQKYLHLVHDRPHKEFVSRYTEKHILYFPEVMFFVYLLTARMELGEENPDKKFLVLNAEYDILGLFSIYDWAVHVFRYAKSCGYIPVMHLLGSGRSPYQDSPTDDYWSKFFQQPEGWTLSDIQNSKNVTMAPLFYHEDIMNYIMDEYSDRVGVTLTWPKGKYSDRMMAYFQELEDRFLPCPETTLGVFIRGTDYAVTHLRNHPIHADPETMCAKIDEVWDSWGGFTHIYLSTEDADYFEYFKQRYGERLRYTERERFSIKHGELLPVMQRQIKKLDPFLRGAEYALDVRLLSRCRSLLGSGECSGVNTACAENGGKYEHVFVFDLGRNPG